jgi:hypothetical protein
MGNQLLASPSRQCFSTPVGFSQGFLGKEQRDNTGAFSHNFQTWLQLIFICSLY